MKQPKPGRARRKARTPSAVKAKSVHYVLLDHTDIEGSYEAIRRMIAEAEAKRPSRKRKRRVAK